MRGWLYFVWVQSVCAVAMVIGWVLLLPICLLHLWQPMVSPKYADDRVITVWAFNWVQDLWGNWEDGVTGVGTSHGPYLVGAPDWLRAYLWSAWRNSCNNLRWVFQWNAKEVPPFYRVTFGVYYFQAGWYADNGFPVMSIGSVK